MKKTLLFAALIMNFAASAQQPKPQPAQPELIYVTGCDTLVDRAEYQANGYFTSCGCANISPALAVDSFGFLAYGRLNQIFDFQISADLSPTVVGRVISVENVGPYFRVVFFKSDDGSITTTSATWEYRCRSKAFFLNGATVKKYRKPKSPSK